MGVRITAAFAVAGIVAGLGPLAGCPSRSHETTSAPAPVAASAGFAGSIYGGNQPIVGATVVAWSAGDTDGAAPVVIGTDTTDGNGRFGIVFSPAPVTGQIVYVVARGGDAGAGANAAIRLMTVAGPYCDSGTAGCAFPDFVNINELSTVAATAALQHYIDLGACPSGAGLGSHCVLIDGANGLADAAGQVNNLVDVATGKASTFLAGPPGGSRELPLTLEKLDTLGSILAACVNGTGETAAACTELFSLATSGTTTVTPTDTLEAAFNIARDPVVDARTQSIFTLLPSNPVFAPVLASEDVGAGSYWTIAGQTYVYVAEQGVDWEYFRTDTIACYRMNDATGNLVATNNENDQNDVSVPDALAVGPRGRFIYSANNVSSTPGDGSVYGFAIDPATGALRNLHSGSHFPAPGDISAVIVDPRGRFVYAANKQTDGSIYGWTLDPVTGELTGISGSPFAAGASTAGLATDTAGNYLYATNSGDDNIEAYSIDQTSGKPTEINTYPAGLSPFGVVVAPGNFLYAANRAGDDVSAWTIDAGGVPAPLGASACGSPNDPHNCLDAGSSPRNLAVSLLGTHERLFASNAGGSAVTAYLLNRSTGAPSSVVDLNAGSHPYDFVQAANGRSAWAANNADSTLTAYDASLAPRALPKGVPTGDEPFLLVLSPDGSHAYVSTVHENLVNFTETGALSGYDVAADGSLTPITSGTGTVAACGTAVRDPDNCLAAVNQRFTSFLITPDGNYLYAFYQVLGGAGVFGYYEEVAAFKANPDGTFTPVTDGITAPGSCTGVSPDNGNCYFAGAGPEPQISPDGKFLYAANVLGDDVSVWKINSDGTLTPDGAAEGAASCNSANGFAVDVPANCYSAGPSPGPLNLQNAPYAYAVNGGSTISAWERNTTTGALAPIVGAPCGNPSGETDPTNCVYAGNGPTEITVAPSLAYAYVANSRGNDVSAYAIDANTGALAPITTGGAGDCFSSADPHDPQNCFAAGIIPDGVTVVHKSGGGDFAYAINAGGADISTWVIGADGALTPVSGHDCGTAATPDPGNCFATGHGAGGVVVNSTDNGDGYAYVVNTDDGTIGEYSIGGNGALTLIGTVFAGSAPGDMTISADGTHVYVINYGENVVNAFDRNGGLLTPLATTSSIFVGESPTAIVTTP